MQNGFAMQKVFSSVNDIAMTPFSFEENDRMRKESWKRNEKGG
jgi:hypothetical protein